MSIISSRIPQANQILTYFAKDTNIYQHNSRIRVAFKTSKGIVTKEWQCRGQDFYPVWYRKWCHGGTASNALAQLIRWCQDKPVLPLSSWEYWASPTCKLFREKGQEVIEKLKEFEYPYDVNCVLCEQPIRGGLDWWSLDGVSGPCCSYTSGCRQKPQEQTICKSELLKRGWTSTLIKKYIPYPDKYQKNPHGKRPMKLYFMSSIEAIEKSEDFISDLDKVKTNRKRGIATSQKRKNNLIQYLESVEWDIPETSEDNLISLAEQDYPEIPIEEACIEFLRNNSKEYQNILANTHFMYLKEAITKSNELITKKILEVYPFLREEA